MAHPHADAVGLSWLIRLRWLTLAAQGLALVSAMTSARPPALWPPLVLLGLLALSNVVFALSRAAPPIGAVLVVDALSLTALLHLTGGPMNPFTALYFVFITMPRCCSRPKMYACPCARKRCGSKRYPTHERLAIRHQKDPASHPMPSSSSTSVCVPAAPMRNTRTA